MSSAITRSTMRIPCWAAAASATASGVPFSRSDEGYVTFLRRSAGAAIDDEERYLLVDLRGFTDASTAMSEMDGPVVDDQGFLLSAQR